MMEIMRNSELGTTLSPLKFSALKDMTTVQGRLNFR